jgi:putative N-acetylmannosamine-6-phosphate epimerase
MYVDDNPALVAVTPVDQAATTLAERMVDVAALDAAVKSGEVVLEPEAGEKLLTTLRGQADAAGEWLNRLRGMSRPVPLGTNWVGQAMSGKFERRAEGEDVSFVNVLDQYHQMLVKAHETVNEAIQRYQATEHGSVQALRRVQSTF